MIECMLALNLHGKGKRYWLGWALGPSPLVLFLVVTNVFDWLATDGAIGRFIVEQHSSVVLGLSYTESPPIVVFWVIAIMFNALILRPITHDSITILKNCRKATSVEIWHSIFLESTAMVIALAFGLFGIFTFLVPDSHANDLHAFNILALAVPNFLTTMARGLVRESPTWNQALQVANTVSCRRHC